MSKKRKKYEWKPVTANNNDFLYSEEDMMLINLIDGGLAESARTTIHCKYVAKKQYINGGWVNIYPTTYLWNRDTDEKLQLEFALDIPVAPKCYFFKQAGDIKTFSLIFPKVPPSWRSFTLVEKTPKECGFVVYDIPRNSSGVYRVDID
jgi:hypothetical protein